MKKPPSLMGLQEKLTGLPTAQKVLLFVGTFAVICAAFYFLKYQDQLTQIKRLKAGVKEQEHKLVTLKNAAAKVKVLEKELEQSEEELRVLMTLLPDQKEIPGLLENVSRLGAKVGLENILFQPQPEIPQEFYATIPIRLDLLGTYNDVGVFLDNISKLNRILKVQSTSLTRPKDKSGLLKVECTVVTYRFLEQPPEPKKGAVKKKNNKKKR